MTKAKATSNTTEICLHCRLEPPMEQVRRTNQLKHRGSVIQRGCVVLTGTEFTKTKSYQDKGFGICIISFNVSTSRIILSSQNPHVCSPHRVSKCRWGKQEERQMLLLGCAITGSAQGQAAWSGGFPRCPCPKWQ